MFDIDLDELVVLYMPTFRDDGSLDAYNLDYSKLIHAFQNKFRKNVKILVRFHPTVDFSFINLQDTNCIKCVNLLKSSGFDDECRCNDYGLFVIFD